MDSRMTIEELASKVEWEGGVEGALDYGVTSDDIEDPQLSALRAKAIRASTTPRMWRHDKLN